MKLSDFESKLQEHAKITKSVIAAPFELKEELNKMEGKVMSKPTSKRITKKTFAIAAVLALCIVTVAMTPLASSIKGFFSDIIGIDGAVTGTKYENATNDIKIEALETSSEDGNVIIPLELTFANPSEAPFPYIQEIAISEYKIFDSNNKVISKEKVSVDEADKGTISNGKVLVELSATDKKMTSGETYTIVIEKMYGLAKADAPLHITGTWECDFIR